MTLSQGQDGVLIAWTQADVRCSYCCCILNGEFVCGRRSRRWNLSEASSPPPTPSARVAQVRLMEMESTVSATRTEMPSSLFLALSMLVIAYQVWARRRGPNCAIRKLVVFYTLLIALFELSRSFVDIHPFIHTVRGLPSYSWVAAAVLSSCSCHLDDLSHASEQSTVCKAMQLRVYATVSVRSQSKPKLASCCCRISCARKGLLVCSFSNTRA